MQTLAAGAVVVARAFRVDNAAACGHPVDVAGLDVLHGAQRIAMADAAFEQIGHGGQPDMWMRTHVHALTGGHRHRAYLVEEDERADGFAMRDRQHATNHETTKIAGAGADDIDDGAHVRLRFHKRRS